MVKALLVAIAVLSGLVIGSLESRGTGVGISLFDAIWFAFVVAAATTVLTRSVSRRVVASLVAFLCVLLLAHVAVVACSFAAADNDFGYIAKDSVMIARVLPAAVLVLTLIGGIRLVVERTR